MNKRFAKIISLMLVLVMVLGVVPGSVFAGPQYNDGTNGFGDLIRNWWEIIVRPLPWYKPTPNYPAQSFGGDDLGGLVVNVEAPAGALPEGTEMYVERVYNTANIQTAVDNSDLINGDVIAAVDITFYHNGQEFQPGSDVKVTLSYAGFDGCDDLSVVHIGASAEEVVNEVPFVDPVEDVESDGETVSFDARDFSIYAVIGDNTNNTRVTVDFYPNETITDSNRNNRQIVFVSSFTGGNTPVYDPGLPNLGANQAFGGWKLVGSGTAPAGFEYGKTYTVNQINEILIANAESYTSDFTLSFAAVVEDVVFVSYTDQNGVVWQTVPVPLNHGTSGDFKYDDTFSPVGQNVGLVGWVVMFEDDVATGNVVEDNEGSFKYKVVAGAEYHVPGSDGVTAHELVLFPLVKSGEWLSFDSNIGTSDTTPATYTAPRFIAEGEAPDNNKPADPTRDGYNFGGWYTSAACTTAFDWDDTDWQSQLTDNKVYAKWNAKSGIPYTVIYWTQSRDDEYTATNANKTWDYYVPTASGVVTSGTANAGSTVTLTSSTSGKTAYNRLGRNSETYSGRTYNGELGYYFKFNSSKTETSKVIRGDGTTVFNVYYDRAAITIKFWKTRNSNGSYSGSMYTFTGLYQHDLPSNFAVVGGYPDPQSTYSTTYGWAMYNSNVDATWSLSSGTAPTCFTSFVECSETWNIHRDESTASTGRTLHFMIQNTSGSYVQFRTCEIDTSTTQNIGGLEFFGFTGVGYNLKGNSTTNSNYHPFQASEDPVISFSGSDVSSTYGAYIYYQRNSWKFDYRSVNETTHANNGNSIYYQADISGYGSYVPTNGPRGCYFTGWYKDPACTQPFTFTGAKMPNHDVIVYAGWEHEYYRVVFDLTDNGKVAPETITIPGTNQDTSFCMEYGKKVDGSSLGNITTSAGYTFGGWFYDAAHTKPFNFDTEFGPDIPTAGDPDGMDMTYANWPDSQRQGSDHWKTWSDVGYPGVRGYIKLYALWRQQVVGSDGIQVRYDAVEGDGLIYVDSNGQVIRYDPFTYTDGALAFTRYSATPNEEGEQFLYWEILDKNGNVVRTVYPGETFPVNLEWAVAEATRPTYTITWHFLTTTGWDSVTTTVSEGDIPSHGAASVEYNGSFYRFTGNWNTKQDGTGTSPVAAEANAEYYAQYTVEVLPDLYTVTFVDHDGTVLSTQQVYAGDSATAPADPTRTGYTFTGWSPADFSNVTSDMTITAQYTVNSYTLTINYVDGSNNTVAASYTGTYNFGAAYNVASPEVEGYTTEQTTVEGTMPARNVTVNVVYTATSTVKVYELVTTAPSDWSGNYVITYGTTTSMYIMKGAAGSSSGTDIESTSNATAYASSGITLDGTKLKNVADDYVFTIAPSGSYYSVKSVSKGSYLGLTSSDYYLGAFSTLNTTYCRWTPGYYSSNASSMYNANSNTSNNLLSFNTSSHYFWSGTTTNQSTNAQNVRLWKETTESGTTTVTYEKTTSLSAGDDVIIVVGSYAVGNTAVTSNHYLSAKSVTVSGSTLTLGSTSEAAVLWRVGGSSSGWTFYNASAGKYIGLDSSYYLAPTSSGSGSDWYWTFDGSDLDNHCTVSGNADTSTSTTRYYRYLAARDTASTGFTTKTGSGNNIEIYKKVVTTASVQPSPAEKTKNDRAVEDLILDQRMIDSEARTTAPEASRETAPTASRANSTYQKVTTLTPGKRYLITYTSGSTAYMITPDYYDTSNSYQPKSATASVYSNTITGDYDANLFGVSTVVISGATYYMFGNLTQLAYLSENSSSYLNYSSTNPYWSVDSSNYLVNYNSNLTYRYVKYYSSQAAFDADSSGTAITFYERVEDTVTGETFNLTSDLAVGNKYIIALGDFAVGNLPVNNSGNDYFINGNRGAVSGSTITLASADVDASTWEIVSGDATNGFVFKNVGNDKYLGMSSDGQCYLAATTLAKAANWTYDGTDLNNNVTETANMITDTSSSNYGKYYYYLSFSSPFMDFTTTISTGQNVKFYAVPDDTPTHTLTIYYVYAGGGTAATTYTATYAEGASYSVTSPTVEGYTPNKAVVSGTMGSSDVTETVTYTQNGGGQTTQMWTPTDTIVPGEPYLIGFVRDGVVYLATNDGAYRSSSSNYYGYSARAVLDSDNAISAHVIGLDDINGRYTDLSSCTWTFSETTGGLIRSTANSNYYLSTYSSSSYRDLYAQSGTSNGTGWYYDAANYSLSRSVGGTTMYAGFIYFYTDEETNMTGSNMGMYSSDPTTDDRYIQLYSLKDVVEGETYTVTFSYYNENGEYVTVTHENVAYGAEIIPPEVPERPGYTFDGWDSEGYLGVTESHDYVAQYIQDGSMTYTVHLRAVYGEKNTTGTTTIVLDANGLTFASDANAILQGLGWSGFASTNETRTMGNLDINASVRIPAGQIFAENGQAGYTFLGWNTKPDGTGLNFSVSGNGENDFGGATEKTVYVDNLDRSSVNTHVNTLYAMWEGSAMFYHSADNTLENSSGTRIFSTYERQNTGVDITAMVKEGFLYGGYYSDYAGKGSYTYGNIGSGYAAYDGTQVAWTESNAYTAIKGNAFNFQSGAAAKTYIGKTIFIKEVPASTYLRPYLHYTYKLDENQTIMNAWLISDVDDLNYNGTGFIIVDSQYGTTKVVSKLTVTTNGGAVTTQTLTPESVFNAKGAKNRLTYREVIGGASLLNEGDMVYNYWITPDGLRVTGARVCQYYNLGSAKNISVTNNDAIGSLITDPSETH